MCVMVGVAQLVEHLVVVQGAAGSSPVTHPRFVAVRWGSSLAAARGVRGGFALLHDMVSALTPGAASVRRLRQAKNDDDDPLRGRPRW